MSSDVVVFKAIKNTKERPEFLRQKANILHLVFVDYNTDYRSSTILTRQSL